MKKNPEHTLEHFNQVSSGTLPGLLGIVFTRLEASGSTTAEMPVQSHLLAPNGFLHAGSVVTLADTCAGYGCISQLPSGANGFTTLELKSNHLGTARSGVIECVARPAHLGKTTQVWDAIVTHKDTGKTIALFRCTQLVLYHSG